MTAGEPCTIVRTILGGLAPRKRRRVSDKDPSTGSTTVRRRTPFIRPMFKNIVRRFLSMEVSKISARQIEAGGAVRAWAQRLLVTVSSRAHLERQGGERAVRFQRDDVDRLIVTSDGLALHHDSLRPHRTHQIRRPSPAIWDLGNADTSRLAGQCLFLLVLGQASLRIKLKVDELVRAQRDDDLSLVRRCGDDRRSDRYVPFVYTVRRSDMSQAVRVDLEQTSVSQLLHCESRAGRQEAGVVDFLDSLADGQDKGTVRERQDDI